MHKQIYKDQLIIDYLLGSLSEEETERLDELSFTDDEFAGRLQAVEDDLVDAYARGELAGQTLERFDSHYMSSPVRREKVRFAQTLQTAAVRVARQRDQQRFVERKTEPRGLRRFFFAPALQWGMAAAVLLMVVGGVWLARENLRLREQVNQAESERRAIEQRDEQLQNEIAGQRQSASEKGKEIENLRSQIARLEKQPSPSIDEIDIVPFTLAPPSRDISRIPTLTIPSRADYVTLQLELESGDYAFYRAELKSLSDDKTLWRSGRLRARGGEEKRSIVVTLRPAQLKSQRYILTVSGIAAGGASEAVAGYTFSVIKK